MNSSISNNSNYHKCAVGMLKTVLFQTIQLSISTQFKFQTLLFNPLIGSNQVLPLRARVDQEVMTMKGYSAFPKAPSYHLSRKLYKLDESDMPDTAGEAKTRS